jgi:hypothetical protein
MDSQHKIESKENINFRKILDSLNIKNQILKDKLSQFGVSKVPLSEIEKKIFFTDNDKMLVECSLVSDVHTEIRKTFMIV